MRDKRDISEGLIDSLMNRNRHSKHTGLSYAFDFCLLTCPEAPLDNPRSIASLNTTTTQTEDEMKEENITIKKVKFSRVSFSFTAFVDSRGWYLKKDYHCILT